MKFCLYKVYYDELLNVKKVHISDSENKQLLIDLAIELNNRRKPEVVFMPYKPAPFSYLYSVYEDLIININEFSVDEIDKMADKIQHYEEMCGIY
ncbi:MAG: hypothetical protein WC679_00495 [Bacteroidales bacterium]|jgi:hypothetical protein